MNRNQTFEASHARQAKPISNVFEGIPSSMKIKLQDLLARVQSELDEEYGFKCRTAGEGIPASRPAWFPHLRLVEFRASRW
jgi:hypothetical protein